MKHLSRIILLTIAAAIAATFILGAAKPAAKQNAIDPALAKKAEAIYLEAVNADEDGRPDDAFMLLRRAAAINPGDPYIKAAVAEYTVGLPTSDSLIIEDAYKAIARRYATNPTDQHNAYVYAGLAQSLGRTDDLIAIWETLDSLMPSRTDPAMNLATALIGRYSRSLDTTDFNRAIDIFNRLEEATGPSLQLASRKIGAYMMRKDTAAIISEINALAASAPADINTNIIAGHLYAGINKPDSALAYLDRAEQIDPSNGKVYLARAQVYRQQNDSIAYDREVFRALQAPAVEYPDKFQLLSDYVVKLYADSLQRPRIEQMFETIQEVNPGESTLHALYGAYKASIDDYDAAAEQFNYSIELDPTMENVWQSLIQVYSLGNRSDRILDTSRRALTYFPGNPYYVLNGAMALAIDDRPGQALALLDSIDNNQIASRRIASTVHATRGDLLYRLGEPDSAFVAYNKAIEEDSENYMALNNCAYYMAQTGRDLDRAELYASIATAANPESSTFLDTYAWVFFKKKDYAKAREIIDRALEIFAQEDSDNDNGEIYNHAGDIYFMDGDRKEALELWKKAHALNPDDETLAKKVRHKTIFFDE
ncbi:MAG: tetratricopeptide repeat protein [Muribaculaceae bacterium]|nr:tetratricopeptide repeat protein [Muribaculaceae bacterium]